MRNDGKVLRVHLDQMQYVTLKGQSEIEGRSMASIIKDGLLLYFDALRAYQRYRGEPNPFKEEK